MLTGPWRNCCLLAVALTACFAGLASYSNQASVVYFTVDGLEPDKWASVWLLSRQGDANGTIEVRPRWALSGDGIPFDVPGKPLYRRDGLTTFQVMVREGFGSAPHLTRLGKVLADLELNAWAKNEYPETGVIERHYRKLQQSFGRNYVPFACYVDFFDQVAVWMQGESGSTDHLATSLESAIDSCNADNAIPLVDRRREYVPTVGIDTILDRISAGSKVVFVDTREPAEYEEGHIPGAINLPLRRLEAYPEELKDADLVISYCVKDFRGYEVAQQLLEDGVANAVIMEPYGIRGWGDMGLPVVSGTGLDSAAETKLLLHCASDRQRCSTDPERAVSRS